MKREQILRFRLERHGLAGEPRRIALATAVSCPASNFNRQAALLAISARADGVSRERFDREVDSGKLVMAPVMRAAIHAFDPADFALLGRSLVATDDDELRGQLGQQMKRVLKETAIAPSEALEEVTEATSKALAKSRKLDKNELHEELRKGVREELMPWCKGCGSHHVAPMLWRYAGVAAGVRRDSESRYLIGPPKPKGKPDPADALRLFLRFYGPVSRRAFADWAGIATAHATRIWDEVAGELVEVEWGNDSGHLLAADEDALGAAAKAEGIRMLPPGDPYLAMPDRGTLVPDADLSKRIFRPVASPGVVLVDGRIAGLWRVKAKGKRSAFAVEELGRVPHRKLEAGAERIAELRGADDFEVDWT